MESAFRDPVPDGTRLIETFGWWPGEGARRLELHLDRMCSSARALGFPYSRTAAQSAVAVSSDVPMRCRLTLGVDGFTFTSAPLGQGPSGPWRLMISDTRLDPRDMWLRHKSSNRALYDRTRADLPEGIDEVLFLNQRGEVCEGTITNVFAELPGRGLVTPPLRSGVLPGILRREMIESGKAQVGLLHVEDLRSATALKLGNSLRGLIDAVF
ncbi:aminotransferase class IV family protein [Shimia biformata]|uniref:aminotransferase class IV family protein n=1 Tax=Shimia biformata TaxID=1294299 RepID=UPI0019519AA4|nr:aminotransferase class IV family protein [Shimia biformata]